MQTKTKKYIVTLYKPITVDDNGRVFVLYVDGYTARPDGFIEIFDDEDRENSLGLLSSSNVQAVVKQL